MDLQDRQSLCSEAAQTLAQTPNHRRLALLWAGVAGGAGLLTSLLSLLLSSGIAGTEGLAGMGTRSMLTTLRSALTLFTGIALPFWEVGHTAAALEISRTQQARTDTLLEGFRRFGPVLRFFLLQSLLFMMIGTVCLQIGGILFTFSPFAVSLLEQVQPLMQSMQNGGIQQLDPSVQEAAVTATVLMMLFFAVPMLLVSTFVFYRLRMASFRLMDEPRCGALQAMLSSVRMLRGNCLALFLLDLRFWWFYLAEAAILLLGYADILLPLAGVTLPMSEQTAAFVFYLASTAVQIGLYTFAKNRLAVTYAKAYDRLRPKT